MENGKYGTYHSNRNPNYSPIFGSGWEFVVLCTKQRSACRLGFTLPHLRSNPRMAMHVGQRLPHYTVIF